MQAFRTKQGQMISILWKVKLVKFLTTSFINYCYQNVSLQFPMSNSFDEMQMLSQSILFNLFKQGVLKSVVPKKFELTFD